MENEKITIPDEIQQICRDFAEVAKKHKLYKFSGNFTPRIVWGGDISFAWENGRHGEDSDEITIQSVFHVRTKVSGK